MTLMDPLDGVHTPSAAFVPALMDDVGAALGAWTSVPGWLSSACTSVFGVDPIAWVEEWAGGDWQAVSRAADMLKQFEGWLQVMNDNTEVHAWSFSLDWQGNASLAARAQFLDAQAAFADAPNLVKEAGQAAEWVAAQMYGLAIVVAEGINAALTAVMSTVFPPAIATLVPRLVKWLLDLIGVVTNSIALLFMGVSSVQAATARLNALPAFDLGAGYDNPLHA